MNRRKFLKVSTLGGGLLAVAGGAAWISISEANGPLTIESLLERLSHISDSSFDVIGEWDLAKILIHCAQSVEYSIEGYPQHKSDLFKSTVGSLAFSMFESKKKMTHGLNEAIPGAPEIVVGQSLDNALGRLEKSLLDFKNFQGKLAPHFAYGELNKAQYSLAHVMHFNNHWSEVSPVSV
jgi:Protein of unknown function (DUF1569)